MWECKWVKSLEYRKSKKPGFVLPLKLCDAFTGGCTEVFKLKVSNAKLRYIDVCSLYPTVMFYDKYPIGQPQKYVNPPEFD